VNVTATSGEPAMSSAAHNRTLFSISPWYLAITSRILVFFTIPTHILTRDCGDSGDATFVVGLHSFWGPDIFGNLSNAYKFLTEDILFEITTHKKPSLNDVYLIHQQGWQGAAEHVSHSDRLAWKSMCATDEGRAKGEKWCKRAIWGNTLPAIKHIWKTVNNFTSGAFVGMWQQRVSQFYSRYSEATAK